MATSTILTPIKAIRANCLECVGHQPSLVRECELTDCTLWPYRMGRRPSTVDKRELARGSHTQEDAA